MIGRLQSSSLRFSCLCSPSSAGASQCAVMWSLMRRRAEGTSCCTFFRSPSSSSCSLSVLTTSTLPSSEGSAWSLTHARTPFVLPFASLSKQVHHPLDCGVLAALKKKSPDSVHVHMPCRTQVTSVVLIARAVRLNIPCHVASA